MTLTELRRKYKGKTVNIDYLRRACTLYTDKDGNRHIDIYYGNEHVYETCIDIDDENRITAIARLKCKELLGDDATRVNYASRRTSEDDYDFLDEFIEDMILEDDDEGDSDNSAETDSSSGTLEWIIRIADGRRIWLFDSHGMLGMVGSSKIGEIGEAEKKINVVDLHLNIELGELGYEVWLADNEIPERWKNR